MMAKKAKAKKSISTQQTCRSTRRFGILNHLGGIWTPETFETEDGANGYLKAQASKFDGGLPKHKVVRVRVTVSVI
jgi:hypothetical protein